MFLDQPLFILLPLVFFYYLSPMYLGYYIGRCHKSIINFALVLIIICLFYILRPEYIERSSYLLIILLPVILLLISGYFFGVLKLRHTEKAKHPYIVGVTGLPCSGKSEASKLFGDFGAEVIDVDKLGHHCLKDKKIASELVRILGKTILDEREMISRETLGSLVFNNKENLEKLEQVLHPAMIREVENISNHLDPDAVLVIDAAILQHMGLDHFCDRVVVITSETSTRIKRASERGWDIEELLKRDEAVRKKLVLRDITLIENNDSKELFKNNIERIWKDIRNER